MPTLRLHGCIHAGLLKTLPLPKSSVIDKLNDFEHIITVKQIQHQVLPYDAIEKWWEYHGSRV